MFRPPNRRSSKFLAKFLCWHFCQPIQRGIYQALARLEFRRARTWSLAVPGADILTDIASENVAADSVANLFGNCAPLFNREVRNAEISVELIRSQQCVRRAGVDAARAGSTAIRGGQIRLKLQRGKNHTEK